MKARRAETSERIWGVLRAGAPMTAADLAVAAGASRPYTDKYLRALDDAGYVVGEGGRPTRWRLARNTGAEAPRLRQSQNSVIGLWDPNLDPPMPPKDLRAIRAATGMSLAVFAEQVLGWSPTSAIHVRRMERGTKVISPDIKARVQAYHTGRAAD